MVPSWFPSLYPHLVHICSTRSSELQMRENLQCLPFWAWIASLNRILSNSIHFPSSLTIPFWPIKVPFSPCIPVLLSIHLLIDIKAGSISLLLWTSSNKRWISWTMGSFVYLARGLLLGHIVVLDSFSWNLHIGFHSLCRGFTVGLDKWMRVCWDQKIWRFPQQWIVTHGRTTMYQRS